MSKSTIGESNEKHSGLVAIFRYGCEIYTVMTLLFLLFSASGAKNGVSPQRFLFLFPFSIFLAMTTVYLNSMTVRLLREILRFAAFMADFFLFLYLPYIRDVGDAADKALIILAAVLGYGVVLLAAWLILGAIRKKKKEKETDSDGSSTLFGKRR